MKKIVFGLLITIGMLNAQNNLVYNQTINLELNQGQEVVIPEGKTWKIEFINVEDPNGINSFNIGILNSSGQYNIHTVYTAANTIASAHLIWLKEGSKIIAGGNPVFVSALEFNVVPTSTGTGSGTGGGGVSSDGLIFSQIINEAIIVQPTNNTGTILYSFEVPVGHVYKVLHLSNNKWNSTYSEYQGLTSDIFISQNGEPINPNRPSLSGDFLFLKEGSYDIVYYTGPNNSSANEQSNNRLYIYAIDYTIP